MKKGILILACLIWSLVAFSQEKYYIHCQLYTESSFSYAESCMKTDVKIFVGEENTQISEFDHLKNKKGKFKSFKSMVDGLNYMSLHGWELLQTYTSSEGTSANSYSLLRKKVAKETLEKVLRKE